MSMAITTNVRMPAAAAPPGAAKEATGAAKPPAAGATTATISAAALAAAKEAAETPAQTAQEAQGSDMQARRLLARETAMKKTYA